MLQFQRYRIFPSGFLFGVLRRDSKNRTENAKRQVTCDWRGVTCETCDIGDWTEFIDADAEMWGLEGYRGCDAELYTHHITPFWVLSDHRCCQNINSSLLSQILYSLHTNTSIIHYNGVDFHNDTEFILKLAFYGFLQWHGDINKWII